MTEKEARDTTLGVLAASVFALRTVVRAIYV